MIPPLQPVICAQCASLWHCLDLHSDFNPRKTIISRSSAATKMRHCRLQAAACLLFALLVTSPAQQAASAPAILLKVGARVCVAVARSLRLRG